MNVISYLQKQFANINGVYHSFVGDLTEQEWLTRPAAGQNMLGFTVWHIPRTQDTHVQTWIRGLPEVVYGDRWAHWRTLKPLGNGVGVSLQEADEIARTVRRDDVLEYADAVNQEIARWLGQIKESDLDQVVDIPQRLAAFPEYQTPGFVAEVQNLFDQPAWNQLMRPCIGHVHRHLGELEIVKAILRTPK